MNIKMLIKARKLWCIDTSTYHQQRHNMREWVRAIRVVGDNWLLNKKVDKNASN
jgi:hypothetical protein